MTHLENLRNRIIDLQELAPEELAEEGARHGLTVEETHRWVRARLELLYAQVNLLEKENSFLKAPLDERDRTQMWEEIASEVMSNATGDGQDEERAEAEYWGMSDWEFKRQYDDMKCPMYEGRPVYEEDEDDEVEPDDEDDSSQDAR